MNNDLNTIEIEINNYGKLRVCQSKDNKKEHTITLESIDSKGKVYRKDTMDEGDFVMLINYYRYTIDKNIKNDFINRDGNSEEMVM